MKRRIVATITLCIFVFSITIFSVYEMFRIEESTGVILICNILLVLLGGITTWAILDRDSIDS